MQRADLHPSTFRQILIPGRRIFFSSFLSLMVIFLSTSLQAGEAGYTLAMVNFDRLLNRNFSAGSSVRPAPLPQSPTSLDQDQKSTRAAFNLMRSQIADLHLVPHLTRRDDPPPRDLFSLTKQLFGWGYEPKGSPYLGAGYGDIFDYRLPLVNEHNGTGWEEPGCGYLKITFTF